MQALISLRDGIQTKTLVDVVHIKQNELFISVNGTLIFINLEV